MRIQRSLINLQVSALLACFALIGASTASTQNLVPNASFESYSLCPTTSGQVNRCVSWLNPSGSATPDYMNACHTSVVVGVPVNVFGNQAARTGQAYMNVFTAIKTSNYREYVQAMLSSPLVAGQEYEVTFYVSLADGSNQATAQIGAHLSSSAVTAPFSQNLPFIPQVENPGGTANVISDKTQWTKISGLMTAAGGEQFITIGNFRDVATTTAVPSSGLHQGACYYIDDVSVTKTNVTGPLVASSHLVGWSDLSPYTAGYIDLQDVDNGCQPAFTRCRTLSLQRAPTAYAGGTAYDSRYQTIWASDGILLAEYYIQPGTSKSCLPRCKPTKAVKLNTRAFVSGLANSVRTKRLFQLATSAGYMEITTYENRGACLGKNTTCSLTLPQGAYAAGLAYDELSDHLFIAVSRPATIGGYTTDLWVASGSAPCRIICTQRLFNCTAGLVTGLAYDIAKKRLYATDGQITQTFTITDPKACQWKFEPGCCKKQHQPVYRGLAVIPAWRKVLAGASCLQKPCAPCATMTISTQGDPSIAGNFEIGLRNGPVGSLGFLFLRGGPLGSGITLPPLLCGRFYALPAHASFPPAQITGLGSCGGSAANTVLIPASQALVGQAITAQWFVLCASGASTGTGQTQALEFSIAGS